MKLNQLLWKGLALDALCLASLSLLASAQGDLSSAQPGELASGGSASYDAQREPGQARPPVDPPAVPALVPTRSLMGSTRALSLSEGGVLDLSLNAGASHAGSFYAMFGSTKSPEDGIWIADGVMLPLAPDAYFAITALHPFDQTFEGYRGRLDERGQAVASFRLAPNSDPGLIGLTLYHAYAVSDQPWEWSFASRAVPVTLEP